MGYKTGRQVFETVILPNLNRKVKVKSVILNSDPQFDFTVCDTKWMMPGKSFTDKLGNVWGIFSVDQSTSTVYALKPSPSATLESGDIIEIEAPRFESGTPRNIEGEAELKMSSNVAFVDPIVWLADPIRYKDSDYDMPRAKTFDFNIYTLCFFGGNGDLNEQRHAKCIYPMTQLMEEIKTTVERLKYIGVERVGSWDGYELSRLGKESKDGFEYYILDMNLSGVFAKASVRFEYSLCCTD